MSTVMWITVPEGKTYRIYKEPVQRASQILTCVFVVYSVSF